MSKPTDTARVEQTPSVAPSNKFYTAIEKQPSEYFAVVNAVQHDTQRKILYSLVQGSGATTYDEIRSVVNVGKRTVRKHAQKLEEKNIVDRPDHNTTALRFTSIEVRALATHALNVWFKKDE